MKLSTFGGAAVAILVAAATVPAPVHAQSARDIIEGVAKGYLNQEQDRIAYGQAQQQNTLAAYRAYIQQFPNGAYVANARAQVRALGGSTTTTTTRTQAERADDTATTAGAGANMSSQQRRQVQQRLTALGYDTSGTDGAFGPGTRRAIALWQRDRSYSQTGSLTTAQANELLRGQGPAATTGSRATPAANSAAQVEANIGLSPSQRASVQQGLTQRGFSTRGVDGSFGPGTRNAIAGWQRANDLNATGYLTANQAQRLMQ